jgi:hypothetical protein
MAIGVFTPTVPSATDILLGEGIIYKNYGVAGSAIIGATRGGGKLEITKKINEMKYDGAYGLTKTLRRYDRFEVKLTVNFLKINYVNLAYGLPVTIADGTDVDGTYKKLTFDMDIVAADVLSNVAFVGQKDDGKQCIIIVDNALNIDNINMDFKEKDELTSEMTYTGFYAYATPTLPPIRILDYLA